MEFAETLVWIISGYLMLGLGVALLFVVFGMEQVEPHSRGSFGFRPLLIPGLTLLWPLVLSRWWAIRTHSCGAE